MTWRTLFPPSPDWDFSSLLNLQYFKRGGKCKLFNWADSVIKVFKTVALQCNPIQVYPELSPTELRESLPYASVCMWIAIFIHISLFLLEDLALPWATIGVILLFLVFQHLYCDHLKNFVNCLVGLWIKRQGLKIFYKEINGILKRKSILHLLAFLWIRNMFPTLFTGWKYGNTSIKG